MGTKQQWLVPVFLFHNFKNLHCIEEIWHKFFIALKKFS